MNPPRIPSLLRRLAGPLLGLAAGILHGQSFDTGSDGGLGDLVVTNAVVLDLPPDGRLKVRSLVVARDGRLRFRPNVANTPVYLLSQGDIQIDGGIHLDGFGPPPPYISGGLGGPGGFRGGNRATDGLDAGPGQGPGGGNRQFGGNANQDSGSGGHRFSISTARDPQNGAAYGSPILIPLLGGSGGGGGWTSPGGGGGGALLLASSTRIVLNGFIQARGGEANNYNGGSGGAVRLVAPTLEGGGSVDVRGNSYGSIGRIRFDSFDARAPQYSTPDMIPSVGSLLLTGLDLAGAPRLEVAQVGRFVIPSGEGNSVSLMWPAGTSPQQNVVVRASNFGRRVPIQVVLTPDSGDRQVFTATIDNTSPGSVEVTVPVTVPANVTFLVNVWTVQTN